MVKEREVIIMAQNFDPPIAEYKKIGNFKFWCQKTLPLVYDDSLSYYEVLCKVVDYVNALIDNDETTQTNVGNFILAFEDLRGYVTDYFTNLDVQEEINHKLDVMAEDGTLDRLIQPLFDTYKEQIDLQVYGISQVAEGLVARMDEYERLPEGSTTGDAELADIRVPAVGFTVPAGANAGTAVRAQITELNNRDLAHYNELNETLKHKAPLGLPNENLLFSSRFIPNKYFTLIENDTTAYSYFEVPVVSGVSYHIYPACRFLTKCVNGNNSQISETLLTDYTYTSDFNGLLKVTMRNVDILEWVISTSAEYKNLTKYGNPYGRTELFAQTTGEKTNIALSQNAVKENYAEKTVANYFDKSTSVSGFISNSSGAITPSDVYESSAMIPVKAGVDVIFTEPIRIMIAFKSDGTQLGTLVTSRQEAGFVWTPEYDGNIRFSYWKEDHNTMMVRYGNTLTGIYYQYGTKVLDESVYPNKHMYDLNGNILNGKKYVACGDSFTEGDFTGGTDYTFTEGIYTGKNIVYPYIIGLRNNMKIVNEAKSGTCIADYGNNAFSHANGRYTQIPLDADYITLKFGINDWHGNVPIGTINDNNNTTFYGAWNVVMSYLIASHPNAKIGIIITNGLNGSGGEAYAEAERNIAKKFGVSYLDEDKGETGLVFRTNRTDIDPSIVQQRFNHYKVSDTNGHPNVTCHKFESTIVEHWIRSM